MIHAYVIMTNHVHMIISRNGNDLLEEIMRDVKKFTSFKLIGAIMDNRQESRKEWTLELFERKGQVKFKQFKVSVLATRQSSY